MADLSLKDGGYLLALADGSGHTYFVDAGTGAVNGYNNLYGCVVFLENLHDCALTYEEYAGQLPWLAAPSAVAGFPPFCDMTWGAVLLAIAALTLVFLAVTAPFIGGAPLPGCEGDMGWYAGERRRRTWRYRRQVGRRRRATRTAD